MRFFILFLLTGFTLTLNAQVGKSDDSDILIENNICSLEVTTTDSLGNRYLSQSTKYDQHGREIYSAEYDSDEILKAEVNTSFPGEDKEISVFASHGGSDTASYTYDALGRLIYERWYWGEDGDFDETLYTYNGNSESLLYSTEKYSWGTYLDTFYYENGNLVKHNTWDNDGQLDMERSYEYKDDLLVSEKEYSPSLGITGLEIRCEYDKKGRKIKENTDFIFSGFLLEQEFFYFHDGTLKKQVNRSKDRNGPDGSTEIFYRPDGLMDKRIETSKTGKKTIVEFSYKKCG